jgi:uncharacterized protein (DUF2132 family)
MTLHFDGDTYKHERDGERLSSQYRRVFDLMRDGCWRTLTDIAMSTFDNEASISARLRDMRKERFGGHNVERRYVANGEWEYRLLVAEEKAA